MHDRISYFSDRLSAGDALSIASDIQEMIDQIKLELRHGALVDYLMIVEECLRDLERSRSDKLVVLSRLESAVYDVHMRAYDLVHQTPPLSET